MKVCRDCTHYRSVGYWSPSCARTLKKTKDIVTGTAHEQIDECDRQRHMFTFWPFRGCGAHAHYFEPRQTDTNTLRVPIKTSRGLSKFNGFSLHRRGFDPRS